MFAQPFVSTRIERRAPSTDEPRLHAQITLPQDARGIIVFVNGCGSSLHSPHDVQYSRRMLKEGYGIMLLDLLTPEEQAAAFRDQSHPSVKLLAHRLMRAREELDRLVNDPGVPVAYFGSGVGAQAAMAAAEKRPDQVSAVISGEGPLN
jgi:putative phosphoribosyl transferase